MGEGSQKVQTSNYKINKSWGYHVQQPSPIPGPLTPTSLQPVRNWAAQQEVSDHQASEASSAARITRFTA